MTKERIILASVAIVTGLIITVSLFSFYQHQKEQSQSSSTQPTIALNENNKAILTLESPQDESVTGKKTITLTGTSAPHALIVVMTSNDDFVLTADENGSFNKDLALAPDENVISITAYTESGAIETKELTVTQNSEEF